MNKPPLIGRKYLKPSENEKIPIVVLDFKKMYACWLPGLRHTLYFEEEPITEELKRIREIILLDVLCNESKYIIEMMPEDFEGFKTAYSLYSTYGGEIYFYRRKEGRRVKNYFDYRPIRKTNQTVKKYELVEKMETPFSEKQ